MKTKFTHKKKIIITASLTAFFMMLFFLNLLLGKSLQPESAEGGISLTGQFLKLFFMFGLVVMLIYGTIWFLNKFIYRRGGNSSQSYVEVIGTTLLSPKKFIYIVKVLDRVLVLGVTDSQISNLTEFTDPSIAETLKKSVPQNQKTSSNLFRTQFEGLLKKK
ncbi:putative bifunctional flagellar biosynthesis protein FliO/FliP [bacterium BMS3Abin05]|nr:putative bifunctional flagellar biosynthesis protein FliO/FliP [bacterium BMS3Abin05]GBE28835.1 putative bifunctional flagellar biosynthesis protein FliO/FliP [bacterium BMS3Bbin03]HDL78190.1 flagellar biosynthetic protein FliO [Bacteroidota bacterium]HDZ11081.1 flagellar biosynthetic protein FliO [Bacteroidota bacterium]